MNFLNDHSFQIGEQHLRQGKPCQDYALSGTLSSNQEAFAIVSDGCSSGDKTDFGSRLVTIATLRALEEPRPQRLGVEIKAARDAYLESYRASLHLNYQDLLATSLFAITNGDGVLISITGDGVIALKYEHALVIEIYKWQNNTPYYPIYRVSQLDNSFVESHNNTLEPFTKKTFVMGSLDSVQRATTGYTVTEGMKGVEQLLGREHDEYGQLQTLALFSDGAEQVVNVPTETVVENLLAFKSFSGQYAVRRMNRFLQEARGTGRGPLDDIAYAVIHYES